LSCNAHLRSEAQQRATYCDTSCSDGGFVHEASHLLVAEAELDPRDDEFAIHLAETLERRVVASQHLHPDRLLERRWVASRFLRRERLPRRTARCPPDRIPQAIPQRFADVGIERAFVAWREVREVPNRLHQRVLDDVLGIEVLSRPAGQAPVRPPPQARQVPGAQLVARLLIAVARTQKEGVRRMDVGLAFTPMRCPDRSQSE
jgi:hypothetical protein